MKKTLFTIPENSSALRYSLLYLFLWTAFSAFPQNAANTPEPNPSLIPPSPTVAAIEKFGDYPIGYNTGTVAISADLYSFPLYKNLNLDIRLDYHSSGIKVESVSDRVGAGWTLLAGGCISRQIMGRKDDVTGLGFYNLIKARKGYTFPDIMTSPSTADSIAKDILDPSPDIFSLNLLGKSYKFFLGNDGEFHTIPYSNLKFNRNPLATEAGGSWEIIDESGVRYIFGLIETITPNPNLGKVYSSSWWLTNIVSPEGITLASFEYKGSNPVYPNIQRNTFAFYNHNATYFPKELIDIYTGEKKHSDQNLYSADDLYKITMPGKGSVVFESGTSRLDQVWKLISEIKYYDDKNVLQNRYVFSYTQQSNRPYLSQIQKTGSDGTTFKYRSFTYYPGLPDQYSKSQDIWGYYNGASNLGLYPFIYTLTQPPYNELSYTSADRYPTDKAIAGTIKEITYPTGGKTLFEFENNKVYGQDNVYTTKKETLSYQQADYGESTSAVFTTVVRQVNMQIEMAIHPAGLYSVDISLIRIDDNKTTLHYTNLSVPGNGFTNMGVNSNGMQRFVLTLTDYALQAGTYKWVTKITPTDPLRPSPSKPSPIIISNDYYRVIESTETRERLVGGLRIAQISNYGSDGKLTGKIRYSYLDKTGKSSGIAAPDPVFVRSYVVTEDLRPGGDLPLYEDMGLIELSEVDLNHYSGSAVQYTYVTEEKTGEGTASIKTDYEYKKREFTRKSFQYPGWLITYDFSPYSPNDYEEGLLLSKTEYEFKNNTYTPVRKETNTYTIKDQGSDIPAFTAISLNKYYLRPDVSPGAVSQPHYVKYQLGTYDIKSAKVYLSSKKMETMETNGTVTDITNYFYDNDKYLQLSRSNQTNSNGSVKEVANRYCYDVSSVVSDSMKVRNIIDQPLFVTTKVNNVQTEQTEVQFNFFNTNKIAEPQKVRKQSSTSAPYSETTYPNYDKYGNPLYISFNEAERVAYLWSYSGKYPIAEIRNTTYAEAEAAAKSVFAVASLDALADQATPNESKLKDGSLQKALPNALVTTYTYKPPFGILTATAPNCTVTYYDYDSFGRLKETYFMDGTIKKTIQSYTYHYQNQ